MGGKRKRPEGTPNEQPQPGLNRTLLKLEPVTRDLLKQLAAFRGETMLATVHSLVVQEIEKNAEVMKRQIDRLVEEAKAIPPPKTM